MNVEYFSDTYFTIQLFINIYCDKKQNLIKLRINKEFKKPLYIFVVSNKLYSHCAIVAMKALLAALCLVSLALPIRMWDFPNCEGFSTESSKICCRSKIRSVYKVKDARFVECVSAQQTKDEEMCEESFSEYVPQLRKMKCGQTCEIDFRHSFGAKCIRDENGNCVPLKFAKNISQTKNKC